MDGHGDMWFKLLILWDVNFIILSNTMYPLKWIPQYFLYGNFVLSYGPFWVNKFYTKLHKKTKCGKQFLLNLFIINYYVLNITIKLMTNCHKSCTFYFTTLKSMCNFYQQALILVLLLIRSWWRLWRTSAYGRGCVLWW